MTFLAPGASPYRIDQRAGDPILFGNLTPGVALFFQETNVRDLGIRELSTRLDEGLPCGLGGGFVQITILSAEVFRPCLARSFDRESGAAYGAYPTPQHQRCRGSILSDVGLVANVLENPPVFSLETHGLPLSFNTHATIRVLNVGGKRAIYTPKHVKNPKRTCTKLHQTAPNGADKAPPIAPKPTLLPRRGRGDLVQVVWQRFGVVWEGVAPKPTQRPYPHGARNFFQLQRGLA